jgi:acyl-CoA-binding protein
VQETIMSDLETRFEQAQAAAKNLAERPDNDTMLKLYGYYKQGSAGDVSGEKPGFFDFVGVAKYEAWEKRKGMPSDEAKEKYIELVNALKG